MPSIIPLSQVAPELIEQLLDRAFGSDRHARTAYRIREGLDWLEGLSFAALDDNDMLAGTIQCWPVALTDPEGRHHPMLMVGPVAVLPEMQGEGYGNALMLAMLEAVEGTQPRSAILPQVMIGDPEYYGRFFSFLAEHTRGWDCPGPHDPARLLLRSANPAILPERGMLGPWQQDLAN